MLNAQIAQMKSLDDLFLNNDPAPTLKAKCSVLALMRESLQSIQNNLK